MISSPVRLLALLLLPVCGLAGAAPAPATPPAAGPADLADLFMPAQFMEPALSPNGDHLAFIARRGDVYAVGLYDFATHHMNFVGGDGKVLPFKAWWKSPRRLLVQTTTDKLDAVGYTAFDVDGKNNQDVWRLVGHGALLDALPAEPQRVLLAERGQIVKFNLDEEQSEKISGSLTSVNQWVLDELGRPRAAMRYYGDYGEMDLWWRASPDGSWVTRNYKAEEPRFYPRAVDHDPRYLVGWQIRPDFDLCVARMDTNTGSVEPLPGLSGLDPTSILMLGRSRLPVAVAYEQGAADKLVPLAESFAPGIGRLQQHFAGYNVRIRDALPDGKTWLVWIGNGRLPGAYLLFNAETAQSEPLAYTHSEKLSNGRLARAEYFTFPRRDGLGQLSARLTRPRNRPLPPLIVCCPAQLPAGVVSDTYDPEAQAFVQLGFAVLRVNVRNSWAFGKTGRQSADHEWTRTLGEDLDDAIHELVAQKAVDGSRVMLLGRDFGGVLALQVAAHSTSYAAVATVNIPSKLTRDDLLHVTYEMGSAPLTARLGGWWASADFAKALSPITTAPLVPIPALYLHDEESIKGRPDQTGREIAAAVKNAKASAQTGLAYHWHQYRLLPSKEAAEEAEVVTKIATYFTQVGEPSLSPNATTKRAPPSTAPRLDHVADFPTEYQPAIRAVITTITAQGMKPSEYFAEISRPDSNLQFHLVHQSHDPDPSWRGDSCGKCCMVIYDPKIQRVMRVFGIR